MFFWYSTPKHNLFLVSLATKRHFVRKVSAIFHILNLSMPHQSGPSNVLSRDNSLLLLSAVHAKFVIYALSESSDLRAFRMNSD